MTRALAILAVAFAACRDRSPSTPPAIRRDAAAVVDVAVRDGAGLHATARDGALRDAAPPEQIPRPSPPWPGGHGPSCTSYVAVSTVDRVSCAICGDGTVDCWGDTSSRVLARGTTHGPADATHIDGISDARAIAVSFGVACTLDRPGRVRCWGNRGSAASDPPHDQGPRPRVPEIVEIPLPAKAAAIEVGDLHACTLLATQDVVCWGVNDWGQAGVDGAGSGRSASVPPRVVPHLRAIHIAVAGNVSCAVDTGHRAWCWGWNGSGAMGTGDDRHRIGPVRVGRFDDVIDIATDGRQGCLRRANQEVWCWGQPDNLVQTTPSPERRPRVPAGRSLAIDGDVISVVSGDGMVATATGTTPPTPIPELPPVRALSSRAGGTCAVLQTGELRCWGDNVHGFLVIALESGSP